MNPCQPVPESTKTSLGQRLHERWPALTAVDVRHRANLAAADDSWPIRTSGLILVRRHFRSVTSLQFRSSRSPIRTVASTWLWWSERARVPAVTRCCCCLLCATRAVECRSAGARSPQRRHRARGAPTSGTRIRQAATATTPTASAASTRRSAVRAAASAPLYIADLPPHTRLHVVQDRGDAQWQEATARREKGQPEDRPGWRQPGQREPAPRNYGARASSSASSRQPARRRRPLPGPNSPRESASRRARSFGIASSQHEAAIGSYESARTVIGTAGPSAHRQMCALPRTPAAVISPSTESHSCRGRSRTTT